MGADDFVGKPFDTDDLEAVLRPCYDGANDWTCAVTRALRRRSEAFRTAERRAIIEAVHHWMVFRLI